jgi:hypothetical protein
MRRSAGVTVAAVVVFVGSFCAALIGVFWSFGVFLVSRGQILSRMTPHQNTASLTLTELVVTSLLCFGFAGGGLVTGIGILRLQNWARISTLIFSVLVAANAILFIPVFWFVSFEIPGIDASSSFSIRMTMGVFVGVLVGNMLWWLVLFSRKSVAEQFLGTRLQFEMPVGITVIASLFIIFALISLAFILTTQSPWDTPTPFFLIAITGVAARIYYGFDLLTSCLAGVGLLWNKVWGFWLAVALDCFSILKLGVFLFFFPVGSERWQKFIGLPLASSPHGIFAGSDVFTLHWFYVLGLIEQALFVLVLLAGKNRYFAVAAQQKTPHSATE